MSVINYVNWDYIALMAFCIINFAIVANCYYRIRRMRAKQQSFRRHTRDLEDDVNSLFASGTTLGNKIQELEKSLRILKEQQEQLTLKEPNQQTYRNAIHSINNGESINQISESSGLSRGEVELLTLLQKINAGDTEKPTSDS